MGVTTTNLQLYKPGGGSTGTIQPDEVVDVDQLNQNFDKIDAFAGRVMKSARMYGTAVERAATIPPVRGIEWFETDTGKTFLSSSTGTWRQMEGTGTAASAAWDATAGTAPAAVYAYRTITVNLPTQIEADETVSITTTGFGNGVGVVVGAGITNNAAQSRVDAVIRAVQFGSTQTQSFNYAWRIVTGKV